ncbi:hypothetical protein [Brevibacillus centrosporus]|uniref:Uncharacterized protein n=1 Tax=Brevibacillus centrosporus TaxID=54910 RepID=A0A1I3RDX9_9BACL|nr:hypothetical protein [Brevibacillus centrosporus]MEC2130324.1 hypothetical protein [Brevibacillus centrosporus]RNB71036.1 hypothetical protein EDM55_09680 [Brevibacillus centrosporus]GED30356.1 hypothetical protein BCE02nite_14970 [Brevibacillus centrosporus]SFJ44864.1 hypothetical protein SAMN05518846_103399 [Brevibacillus centrosporus]
MSGDFVADLLGKLSKKTGREWTLADIMKLAEKFPKGGSQDIDAVMSELSDMGLNVPEETKEKVKERMKSGKSLTMDELGSLMRKDVKGKRSKVKKPKLAAGRGKPLSLAQRVKKLSAKKKKNR